MDASSLINLLVFPEDFSSHRDVLDDDLIAPAILVPEFLNGIRKLTLTKRISTNLAHRIVTRFEGLQVELFTMSAYRRELRTMTKNLSPYDATYVLRGWCEMWCEIRRHTHCIKKRKIVEQGSVDAVINSPLDPCTQHQVKLAATTIRRVV